MPGTRVRPRERSRGVDTPRAPSIGRGRVLDRAMTLLRSLFRSDRAVLAVVSVPLTALQAFVAPDPVSTFYDMERLRRACRQPFDGVEARARTRCTSPTCACRLSSVLLRLLQWNALVAVIAAAYAGTRFPSSSALSQGVRRWPAQLVVALMFLVLGAFASIPGFIVYFVLFMGVGFTASAHRRAVDRARVIVGGLSSARPDDDRVDLHRVRAGVGCGRHRAAEPDRRGVGRSATRVRRADAMAQPPRRARRDRCQRARSRPAPRVGALVAEVTHVRRTLLRDLADRRSAREGIVARSS